MKLEEALEIVYDLAIENALPTRCDPLLSREAKRQQEALSIVHDFMVNVVSEVVLEGRERGQQMGEINLETEIEDTVDSGVNLPIRISIVDSIIWIGAKGYGTMGEEDPHGYPIGVELIGGELKVILWDNINYDDPKVISMEGASEKNRREV